MNREKKNKIPSMQVGFIDAICLQLYEVRVRALPPRLRCVKAVTRPEGPGLAGPFPSP